MYCYVCWYDMTKVIDSRTVDSWKTIRRRRECENCGERFTTYERRETTNLIVIKSWNKKEKYDKNKLEESLIKATNKRNISILEIEKIIKNLESSWERKSEISSKEIWVLVLDELKKIDEVAYIRFASVHLNLETPKDFIKFIQNNINF